jgi:hypothetical protein
MVPAKSLDASYLWIQVRHRGVVRHASAADTNPDDSRIRCAQCFVQHLRIQNHARKSLVSACGAAVENEQEAHMCSFPTQTKQWLRYVSDRTGIISFANFPIIWLFGMRNNFAIWLTGWDFGTYNNFHRWVARIATLQAVIHSVGYTVLVFNGTSTRQPHWVHR